MSEKFFCGCGEHFESFRDLQQHGVSHDAHRPMTKDELMDECRKMDAEIASLRAKTDLEMERLKACEHIAEGEVGCEVLFEMCPSTQAVSVLRLKFESLRKLVEEKDKYMKEVLGMEYSNLASWSRQAITKIKQALALTEGK